MIDLGTVLPGSTIRIPFSSFDKDDGSSITMTNFAAADILIYKDGSTTERASTAGFTATTDFDGKTGKHLAIIDLADDTTADFYKAGSEYLVAIDAVTVDAVTTGGWIARFRIGYPGAQLDTSIATLASQTSFTLTTGPAEDDALNGHELIVHDKASAVQSTRVVIEDYTGSTKTVTLRASPATTFTIAAGDNVSVREMVRVDVTHWIGTAAATPTVAGVPEVDVTHLLGTAWLTPGTAGTPDVNMKLISDDATAANNLETMLDGTGGQTLSLGRLVVSYDVGGGAGLAAVSIQATNGTSGTGIAIAGVGTSAGILVNAGATGTGLDVRGGSTSGDGVKVTTTSGHGVNLAPVGTNMHGLLATGGNGGTSDGIKAVAGTGGVPIRGDITGNITGNLSGSVGSVTGAVGSVTGAVGSVTGNVGGNVAGSVGSVTGAVGSVTGAVGSVTGNVGGNVAGSVGSVATGGIAAASFAAGAIDAASIAADAGTEIGTAVWASATRTLTSGGGSATVPQIIGGVTKSGSTYYVTYALLIDGAIVTSGLGTLSVTFYDEDGTDLTFSGTPVAGATGLIYASGTLTTPVTDNRPVMVKVAVTKDAVARSTFLPAVSIA